MRERANGTATVSAAAQQQQHAARSTPLNFALEVESMGGYGAWQVYVTAERSSPPKRSDIIDVCGLGGGGAAPERVASPFSRAAWPTRQWRHARTRSQP